MNDYIQTMRKYIGHERLMCVGTDVFLHENGKLLLQRRKDNGCWGSHGGCVEIGEVVEEAARRELFEETGLVANSLELIGVFSGKELLFTYPNGDKVAIVAVAFLCEDFSGEMISQPEEITDLQWFGIDALPENIHPPTRQILARCVEILKAKLAQED